MNSLYYKHCMVPQCKNTTIKTPNKLFIHVPTNEKVRIKWLKLAKRDDAHNLSKDSAMYFCEDHFDLPNDMINYMEYHIMGKVSQVRTKLGCKPTKFECQKGKEKRKRCTRKRPSVPKTQKRTLEDNCSRIPSSTIKDTPNSSSNIQTIEENVEEIVCEPEQTAYENILANVAHKFKSKDIQTKKKSIDQVLSPNSLLIDR